MRAIKNAKGIAIAILSQIGESTHSHDHSITPVSLSTIKTIVSKLKKLPPPEEEFELLIIRFLS